MSPETSETPHEEDTLEIVNRYTNYAEDVIELDNEDIDSSPESLDELYADSSDSSSPGSSRETSPKPSASRSAENLIEQMVYRFGNIKRNDPDLPELTKNGDDIRLRRRSWINKKIRYILRKREYYSLRNNKILPLVPYDATRLLSGHSPVQYRLLTQFNYIVMAGIYWAGLKAYSDDPLGLDDILPFRIVDNVEGPLSSDYRKLIFAKDVSITIRITGSCPSRVDKTLNREVFDWISTHMEQYWCSPSPDRRRHKASIKRYMHCARNYIVATMLAMFESTDFLIVNIPQFQLRIGVDRLYSRWNKLYEAGWLLNKRLHALEQDTFSSKDIALYADYIVRRNYFTRLITDYPDVGEFIDHYFHYFRFSSVWTFG